MITCIDLDGTLIKTDMLYESFLYCFKKNPLVVFLCAYWLLTGGKTKLKSNLAKRFVFDVLALPFNKDVIKLCTERKAKGDEVYLVSASDSTICKQIERHFSFFTPFDKPRDVNLAGNNKAKYLVDKFGEKNFDYAGNSSADLEIWKHCKNAICVNCSKSTSSKCKIVNHNTIVVSNKASLLSFKTLKAYLKMIRVHQWVKNLLVFVPLVASHTLPAYSEIYYSLCAFIAFSLLASSVYITNDLLDLESDRKHHTKKNRPLAACKISIPFAVLNVPMFVILSYIIAFMVNTNFVIALSIYFVITILYSFVLKRLVIIDCITLAILYTGRIVAGVTAIAVPQSIWLIIFSIFFFLALAFIKRYAELHNAKVSNKAKASGRGYLVSDLEYVGNIGLASAFVSIIIFCLYLNEPIIQATFTNYYVALLSLPILTYWLSYLFLKCFRGEMLEDPVVFAIKDNTSLITGFLFSLFFFLGGII